MCAQQSPTPSCPVFHASSLSSRPTPGFIEHHNFVSQPCFGPGQRPLVSATQTGRLPASWVGAPARGPATPYLEASSTLPGRLAWLTDAGRWEGVSGLLEGLSGPGPFWTGLANLDGGCTRAVSCLPAGTRRICPGLQTGCSWHAGDPTAPASPNAFAPAAWAADGAALQRCIAATVAAPASLCPCPPVTFHSFQGVFLDGRGLHWSPPLHLRTRRIPVARSRYLLPLLDE